MIKLGFTYIFTNDIPKMKWFYRDLLGLNLIWDQKDDIAFMIDNHQFSIQYHEAFTEPSANFAIQPGWKGGTEPRTSWSIDFDPVSFQKTIDLLTENRIATFHQKPKWQGYWSYPVLDPMNNTVEITCSALGLRF